MLSQPCPGGPASQYGIENLKNFSEGRVRANKSSPRVDLDYNLAAKADHEPVSDFDLQLMKDHPSITANEARDITFNLLRSAAHAASMSGGNAVVAQRGASSASSGLVVSTNKHIHIFQDRKITLGKQGTTRKEPPPARPDPPLNPVNVRYNTARESMDRLDSFPVQPYLFLPPDPAVPVIQPIMPPPKKHRVIHG